MKKNVKFISAIVLSLMVGFTSCKKDKDDDEPAKAAGYTELSAADVLQGNMKGTDWTFSNGYCDPTTWDNETSYWFNLYDTLGTDSCSSIWADDIEFVLFSLDESEFKVGKYEFSASGQNITAYISVAGDGVNYVITDGSLEITEIDTAATGNGLVKGVIDAYNGSDLYLKGTFAVKYCD